jgi:hypothetical protein
VKKLPQFEILPAVTVSPFCQSRPGVPKVHCPRDVVVSLNANIGIYHEKGMRWYRRTRHGAFLCRKEADAAGDRDTRNGQ